MSHLRVVPVRTIGVIGCGVVGAAVAKGFATSGMKVRIYDKFIPEMGDYRSILKTEAVFICVPTPTRADGTQDIEALTEVFAILKSEKYEGIIVVKSTVLPGTTEHLSELFKLPKVCHNPEFLTAARPFEDFMEQQSVLIGSKNMDAVIEIGELYYDAGFRNIRLRNSATSTETTKYMRNNFGATKVSFFNEQYEVCKSAGVNYNQVLDDMLSIGGIERQWTVVPGIDGLGYGGMCFPKDSLAQLTWGKDRGLKMEVLEGTVVGNKRRREVK